MIMTVVAVIMATTACVPVLVVVMVMMLVPMIMGLAVERGRKLPLDRGRHLAR